MARRRRLGRVQWRASPWHPGPAVSTCRRPWPRAEHRLSICCVTEHLSAAGSGGCGGHGGKAPHPAKPCTDRMQEVKDSYEVRGAVWENIGRFGEHLIISMLISPWGLVGSHCAPPLRVCGRSCKGLQQTRLRGTSSPPLSLPGHCRQHSPASLSKGSCSL